MSANALAALPPIGRLTPEAVAWLAEAAQKADELTNPHQVIWIALIRDGFVVHGVRGGVSAVRPVPHDKAAAMNVNLLLTAVLAVDRELNPRRDPRPMGRTFRSLRRPQFS